MVPCLALVVTARCLWATEQPAPYCLPLLVVSLSPSLTLSLTRLRFAYTHAHRTPSQLPPCLLLVRISCCAGLLLRVGEAAEARRLPLELKCHLKGPLTPFTHVFGDRALLHPCSLLLCCMALSAEHHA